MEENMEEEYDKYAKLRPWTDIESCQCKTLKGLLLVNLMTANPIHCIECRCEIDPERLGLTSKEVDQIASWYNIEQSLYNLWLNSGEYEDWAKSRMVDKNGLLIREGMKTAQMLSKHLPTYYWWFHDTDDGTPEQCPMCNRKFNEKVNHGTGQCESCKIRI